jgi:large subunit ribosomal protein L31
MKKNIHPKLNKTAKVTDLSTGKTFNVASTKDEIAIEVTYLSHPFYTGKHRIVDTENLVKKFNNKSEKANVALVNSKKEKKALRSSKTTELKASKKLSLKDMLKNL